MNHSLEPAVILNEDNTNVRTSTDSLWYFYNQMGISET